MKHGKHKTMKTPNTATQLAIAEVFLRAAANDYHSDGNNKKQWQELEQAAINYTMAYLDQHFGKQ